MTFGQRVQAIAKLGFTERQAGFLVTVMLHAGVCLSRQYCTYAGIVRGQKIYDFFSSLAARQLATVYTHAHRQTHIYHVHARTLYSAIGEPHNRHRRPTTLARAIERLVLLDAVLADREARWLATEREKVEHFSTVTTLRLDELPRLVFGTPPKQTVRYFPDKLPIGIAPDSRTHVFLYVVTRMVPVDFRAFLHRHAELLRALPWWELRLLVPRHLAKAAPLFERAAHEELANPLRLATVSDLQWFFRQRQAVDHDGIPEDAARFQQMRRAYGAPRFRALYRAWLVTGDKALHGTVSPVISEALTRRNGQVNCHVLPRSYQHLLPLVGTA